MNSLRQMSYIRNLNKLLAFVISAPIGVSGCAFLGPIRAGTSAGTFEFWESTLIVCMIVLAGMGSSIRGAIMGGAVLASLGEVLRWVLPYQFGDVRYLICGIILLLLILLMRFRPDELIPKKT